MQRDSGNDTPTRAVLDQILATQTALLQEVREGREEVRALSTRLERLEAVVDTKGTGSLLQPKTLSKTAPVPASPHFVQPRTLVPKAQASSDNVQKSIESDGCSAYTNVMPWAFSVTNMKKRPAELTPPSASKKPRTTGSAPSTLDLEVPVAQTRSLNPELARMTPPAIASAPPSDSTQKVFDVREHELRWTMDRVSNTTRHARDVDTSAESSSDSTKTSWDRAREHVRAAIMKQSSDTNAHTCDVAASTPSSNGTKPTWDRAREHELAAIKKNLSNKNPDPDTCNVAISAPSPNSATAGFSRACELEAAAIMNRLYKNGHTCDVAVSELSSNNTTTGLRRAYEIEAVAIMKRLRRPSA
ncbi:hypothetical protein EIP86_007841 [Pleurotus ostreatoroseus]|nr:hypothetical protein EIP86_007841 [Pleurotus ostreatoroseus]